MRSKEKNRKCRYCDAKMTHRDTVDNPYIEVANKVHTLPIILAGDLKVTALLFGTGANAERNRPSRISDRRCGAKVTVAVSPERGARPHFSTDHMVLLTASDSAELAPSV